MGRPEDGAPTAAGMGMPALQQTAALRKGERCGDLLGRREGWVRSSSSERRGEPAGEEAMRHLRIALAQINVTVGDLEGKATRIIDAVL